MGATNSFQDDLLILSTGIAWCELRIIVSSIVIMTRGVSINAIANAFIGESNVDHSLNHAGVTTFIGDRGSDGEEVPDATLLGDGENLANSDERPTSSK